MILGIAFFKASPTYCDIESKDCFMVEYSSATRCVLYKREAIFNIKGFVEDIITFEDIDIYYRLILSGVNRINIPLEYYHSPDIFKTKEKALSVHS